MHETKKSTPNVPLPRMNIIGSGKLGGTLARLLSDSGQLTIGGIYNRRAEHSQSALRFIGTGRMLTNIEQFSSMPAELWMLATPDDAISTCAAQLAELSNISWQDAVVFHSSGLKTSTELSALKDLGSSAASAHPAHSFASPERSLSSFASTVCTLEGDAQAVSILTTLFKSIGGQVTIIEPETKPLYHAATVMASNYLIALLGASEALLKKAGINEPLAGSILSPLMQQSLQNGQNVGPVNALTGPIARGDINTIEAHIKAIKHSLPELQNLYSSLGSQALLLAQQQGTLSQNQRATIERLLHEE